ncbi:hypothetical protein J2S43_004995 [Catenuloplanes nepalensis]|uniref:Uncharacterized protein n=1 Tax=Catenuloplanes nepalensis TaxID=587533 RepID=A0ABT9MYJ1_9ACTN|nr:hypothetical protein [Catenuloplanes nepalensis]MDP9796483.1 hypothetical protein [Catenuloplanes nepalensis]
MPVAIRSGHLTWVTRRTLRLAGAFAIFVLAFTGGWPSSTSDASPAPRVVATAPVGGIDLVPAGAETTGITPASSAVDVVQAPLPADRQPALPGPLPLLAVAALLLVTLPECRGTAARTAPDGPRGDRAPPLCPA